MASKPCQPFALLPLFRLLFHPSPFFSDFAAPLNVEVM